LDLLPDLFGSTAQRLDRLGVQDVPRVSKLPMRELARVSRSSHALVLWHQGHQLRDPERSARMPKQRLEIVEALRITEADTVPLISDRPEMPLPLEADRRGLDRHVPLGTRSGLDQLLRYFGAPQQALRASWLCPGAN